MARQDMLSLERQSSGDDRVEDGEDDEAVDEEAEDDGGEVPAQLHQHLAKVAHAQHLDQSSRFKFGNIDASTCPPIRKKTPIGARLITQVVIT